MPTSSSSAVPRRATLDTFVRATLLCAATLVMPASVSANSMRCDGKLIQVSDPKARLLAECGEPLSKDVVAVVRAYQDAEPVRVDYVEEWSYAAPNTTGFDVLRFEGGRLTSKGIRCNRRLIVPGFTMTTVLQRCGDPISRDSAGLRSQSPGPASIAPVNEVLLEQWVYDRGPGQLLAIVTVRGGRVAAIEDGPRR